MEFSPELKKLIDASFADGKITASEKKILVNRAIKEGHDEDEFKLYLDSLIHTFKSEKKSQKTENAWTTKSLLKKGLKGALIFSGLILTAIIVAIIIYTNKLTFDEALTEYNFEEARNLVSDEDCYDSWIATRCERTIQMVKLINAEVDYFSSNDAFEKAASSIQELATLEYYEALYEDGQLTKSLTDLTDDLYLEVLTKGIVNKKVTERQVNVWMSRITSEEKVQKVKLLID